MTKTLSCKAVAISTFPSVLVLTVAVGLGPRSYAQAQAQPDTPTKVATLHEPSPRGSDTSSTTSAPPATAKPSTTTAPDPEMTRDIARELAAMKSRIEQLELELKSRTVPTRPGPPSPEPAQPAAAAAAISATPAAVPAIAPASAAVAMVQTPADSAATPEKKEKIAPFSDWDWTWLNGNPRNKDTAFDTKFFTPEIRADITYTFDFNRPQDNSMGGSSELFRSNEIQLEQLGIGGDFHWDNVRARFMTQFGEYSMATIRNDPSPAKGQWNLDNADRYLAEAYGGYHINALHGINIDAGIFMSYIGLFSYYNFDNWAYQPSYVSSNTPWFFNGMRVQIFPTEHLKIEPWIINGWQSYGRFNGRLGVGGQILWRPNGWFSILGNQYALGEDAFNTPGRVRYHTDDSMEVKYYDRPGEFVDKMAFSLTGDLGCEHGGGVSCAGDSAKGPKQSFIGFMLYDRTWFHNDKFGLTIGGGKINNPGRYLVLLPPINGATAASGTPYFTENPGDPFKAWDASLTFDWMPSQYITFRWEFDHRAANVPYWTGPGGLTPP